MAISDEITRLQQAKAALKTSIEGKGVTVSSDATLDDYPALVDSIEAGGGSSVSDGVWWFCSEYRRFAFEDVQSYWWSPWGSIMHINMEGADVWFEYNGEKYYIDSATYGTHIMTKQGAPVKCKINQFVTIRITKQGDIYSVYMEDN